MNLATCLLLLAAAPQTPSPAPPVLIAAMRKLEDESTRGTAMDELQASMLVVPSEVVYQPRFTYIWSLAAGQFPDQLRTRMRRKICVVSRINTQNND